MNREVFLSILATDSYNRGYAQGIKGLNGTSIGAATIIRQSNITAGSPEVAAGFFASAYQWGAETIISYRGTDFDPFNAVNSTDGIDVKTQKFFNSEFYKDLANGWRTFLTPFPSAVTLQGVPGQFDLARAFFRAVVPGSDFSGEGVQPAYNNITVTGHSLGGALAGYVDSRVNVKSYLVDPIPYGATAWVSAIVDAWQATLNEFQVTFADLVLALVPGYVGPLSRFVNSFADNLRARRPQLAQIEGVYLEDEIATRILELQPALGSVLAVLGLGGAAAVAPIPIVGAPLAAALAFLSGLGIWQTIEGVINNVSEDRSGLQFQAHYGALDLIAAGPLGASRSVLLHSSGLLTILLYGDKQWLDDGENPDQVGRWRDSIKYFGNGIFDADVAKALGRIGGNEGSGNTGLASANEQLARIIGYSAINEGTRVFGDTGIRALFNDGDDLGQFIKYVEQNPDSLAVSFDEDTRIQFGRLIAEYAGLLATQKVLAENDPDALQGVLGFRSGTDNNGILIDFRDETWTVGALGTPHESIVKALLIEQFLSESSGRNNLDQLVTWYAKYAQDNGSGKLIEDIDEIILSLTAGSIAAPRDEDGVALQIGSTGNDEETFSSGTDFVIGGKGDDKLTGGDGSDILLGGDGTDNLYGGAKSDRLEGGRGEDNLQGGGGDDYLIVEADGVRDVLEGGSGTDTVVYVFEPTATVSLSAPRASEPNSSQVTPLDFGININAQSINMGIQAFGPDELGSIERAAVELGFGDDKLFIENNGLGINTEDILYIDLGAGTDTIDLSAWEYAGGARGNSAFVDLSQDIVTWADVDAKGQPIPRTLTVRGAENVLGGSGNDVLVAGIVGGNIPVLPGNRAVTAGAVGRAALTDVTVLLDGGAGNDTIVVRAGAGSIAVGGLGRDVIINQSAGGILYGDVQNSNGDVIADDASNADYFQFAPNTIIADAQHSDVLFFFGVGLTGGDAGNTSSALNLSLASGYSPFASSVTGQFALQAAYTTIARRKEKQGTIYFDTFLPNIAYTTEDNGEGGIDLLVYNLLQPFVSLNFGAENAFTALTEGENVLQRTGVQRIKNFDLINASTTTVASSGITSSTQSGFNAAFLGGLGDLGLVFRDLNPLAAISLIAAAAQGVPLLQSFVAAFSTLALGDAAAWVGAAATRSLKAANWLKDKDPLVIDLDGDGIEIIGLSDSRAYFDSDGDLFRERTGWLKGDDGFLVLDSNRNGRIDDISELFGNATQGGYAELAAFDSNGDGRISVGDLIWSELQIWQDYDRDGVTDAGELKSLDALGIVTLNLAHDVIDVTTPQGARLLARGDVTFADGRVTRLFEAIFNTDDNDTRFAGEAGRAPWQTSATLNAKGFGTLTDLAVAAANDVGLAELAQARAAAMTPASAGAGPNIRTLVALAGDVLGAWGGTLERSRELIAVKLSADGTSLIDRAVYTEDANGGFWALKSGAAVLDATGAPIARASLEQVLAQGAGWRLEQAWSPSTRGAAVTARDEAPYLTQIVNGRAVILDYGIKQSDGTWKLASDPLTSYASVAQISALPHGLGTEWRVEDIQFNPLADLPVAAIGVYFVGGEVKDYTVQVTDQDGSFYVWARNLDRALQLQAKVGSASEFNLRNYEVDFETLDTVGSNDDSTFRVELLTPAQFHFATSLGGIDFRPEILTATYVNATGQLSYSVNGVRSAGRYVNELDAAGNPVTITYSDGSTGIAQRYESDVKTIIEILQRTRARPSGGRARAGAMEQYGHRAAVAVNDNDAWPERPFHLCVRRAA